jgi:hypothetical protein
LHACPPGCRGTQNFHFAPRSMFGNAMKPAGGPVLATDGDDIGHDEFARADAFRRAIVQIVEMRESYVRENDLDPAFCLPAANWRVDAENDFLAAYRHVRDGGYDVLNRLRFWTQAFSGYSLMALSGAKGTQSVRPIPEDLDRRVISYASNSDRWRRYWRRHTRRIPNGLVFSPPLMLGEIGVNCGGVVVNHDTYVYQERINLLYEAGVIGWLRKCAAPPRILEIGGGYGALATALRQILPGSRYAICDLPESLLFSGLYLRLAAKEEPSPIATGDALGEKFSRAGVVLLPNYLFDSLARSGVRFDLVINTLSMSEMSELQIRRYCEGIAWLIDPDGVFFEQNHDNRHLGMLDCKGIVRRHFPARRSIDACLAAMTEGKADLWANRGLEFLDSFAPALGRWPPVRRVLRRAWRLSGRL